MADRAAILAGLGRPTPDLARQWRQVRWNPLARHTPARLSADLDAFKTGYLRAAALLWEAIEERDYMVRTAVAKRKKSAARRDWEILLSEDSPEAQAHKATLEWAYNHLSASHALDLNVTGNLRLLIKQMLNAEFSGYAVHEILWTRPLVVLPDGGRSAQLELRYVPLYLFENTTGRLRYTGALDATQGTALEAGGWMITTGDALMEAISVCWTFKRYSLQDWLNFSEKFGMPGIHGETGAAKGSPEWNDFVSALQGFANDWIIATAQGSKVNLVEAGKTGDAPFRPMVEHMDRAIACLCRGADLSTISSQDGAGASLQGDETQLLEADDCALISETLNEQLDRLLIAALYGEGTEPLAYFRLNPPAEQDADLDMKVDDHLRDHGVPLAMEDMAERYGRTLPSEGEELTLAAKPADGRQQAPGSRQEVYIGTRPHPAGLLTANDRHLTAEDEALRQAVNADLAPVRAALEQILRGGSDLEQQTRLHELADKWPEITDAVLAGDSLDAAMERIFSAAFVEGLDLSAAAATARFENANPNHDHKGRFTFGSNAQVSDRPLADVQEECRDAFRLARSGQPFTKLLGTVSDRLAEHVRQKSGADITGMGLRMDDSNVRHALNYHPNLTEADFGEIPRILLTAESITAGFNNRGLPALSFKKRLTGRNYELVEMVFEGRHQLALNTFKKFKQA